MKIALCLSGQPRYLDIGYKSLFDCILAKYNVDVFSHVWYSDDMCGKEFEYGNQYNRSDRWETGLDKKIIKLYQPKKYKFETPRTFCMKSFVGANFESLSKPENVLSMFYSIKQANNLRQEYEIENNFKYDLVIRSRTDLILQNFNIQFENIDKNKIYCHSADLIMFDSVKMCNDQFAIGSGSNMDVYCSIFDYLEYYWKNCKLPSLVGERVLTTHLYRNNIPVHCCERDEMWVSIYTG